MEANLLTILPKYLISLNQIELKPSFQDQYGEHNELARIRTTRPETCLTW